MNKSFNTVREQQDGDSSARKIPFIAEKESNKFHDESICMVIRHFAARMEQFVPKENQQVLYHGQTWNYLSEEGNGELQREVGKAEKTSAKIAIEVERIITNDVSLVSEFIEKLVVDQTLEMERRFRAQVDEILKLPGNTVAVPEHESMIQAYLNFIKNSHPLCDITGKPTRVNATIDPDAQRRLEEELAKGGPLFRAQFEKDCKALWAEKERAAIEKEAQRLARYDE
jgi:hypothetical protein